MYRTYDIRIKPNRSKQQATDQLGNILIKISGFDSRRLSIFYLTSSLRFCSLEFQGFLCRIDQNILQNMHTNPQIYSQICIHKLFLLCYQSHSFCITSLSLSCTTCISDSSFSKLNETLKTILFASPNFQP